MARRSILALAAALAISLAVAAPASAVKPTRGCTDSFDPWNLLDYRAYLNSPAFLDTLSPEGQAVAADILAFINSDAWLAIGMAYDKNGDEVLCIKPLPANKGHLFGWGVNAVDNIANS